MQPSKTTVTGLFATPHQYQIPIFQRGYVWTLEKQVAPLWADIQDRANALQEQQAQLAKGSAGAQKPLPKHFLGSIVMTPVPNAFGRVSAFEVIDGQQRSTTLQLLLLAFRLAAQKLTNSPIPQMLEGLIENRGPFQRPEDHYKVWPTQAGKSEMRQLCDLKLTVEALCAAYPVLDGKKRLDRPLMVQTFLYLYHACLTHLRGIDMNDPADNMGDQSCSDKLIAEIRRSEQVDQLKQDLAFDANRAQALYMALNDQIQIMTLTLEPEDDPQVIFETLNARGEPLLASDLVRNFLFLEASRQGLSVDSLYTSYWSPFDLIASAVGTATTNHYWREKERIGRLTYPRIDLFFFNYTVLRSREITLTGHVFQSFKAWWLKKPSRQLESELKRLVTSSQHFRELVSPEGTGYLAEFARLIKALDVGTIAPVYLALRERLSPDSQELRLALADLASFFVRRAVCGMSSKSYSRFFVKILNAITDPNVNPQQELQKVLLSASAPSELWPDDAEFEDKWHLSKAYKELRPAKVCGILRALEYAARGPMQGSNHVPQQKDMSIEHVLPQSWKNVSSYQIADITDIQLQAREFSLHSFGNLTLLTHPLNSSVSNGPFADSASDGQPVRGKQSQLGLSVLLLNTYFQNKALTEWDEASIKMRSNTLFKAALFVWPKPVTKHAMPIDIASALAGN